MNKILNPLPISEEMLGAYLEGNLSASEAIKVESVLENDTNFSKFVSEITPSDEIEECSIFDDEPDFINNFELPNIPGFIIDLPDISINNDDFSNESLCDNTISMFPTESFSPLDAIEDFNITEEMIADEISLDENSDEFYDNCFTDNDASINDDHVQDVDFDDDLFNL